MKRLISEPIDSTDAADKHARYISRLLLWSGEVEKVTNELGDNGAHRCVDCFQTRLLIRREGTPLQTQGLSGCLVPFAARMAANRSCFSASSCLTPNKRGFAGLIKNKVDY